MWGEGNVEMEKQKGYLTVVGFGEESVPVLDITMYYFVKMDYAKKERSRNTVFQSLNDFVKVFLRYRFREDTS